MNETFNTYNKIAKKYEEEYGNDLSDTHHILIVFKKIIIL